MTLFGRGARATWIKTGLVVIGLYAIVMVCPDRTVDSWQIFNPKKVALMVFALALIQALGEVLRSLLGDRRGAIVGGFLAGLVSSTAATATIARRRMRGHADTNRLTFLSATLAMMFEGLVLVIFGADGLHGSLVILFLGPMAMTSGAIVLLSRKTKETSNEPRVTAGIDLVALLKLSVFIVGIISLSKVMQVFAGQSGLLFLTFVVSLFEIHGSLIANIQLHDAGTFGVSLLGGLLTVSIAASVISKCGLVYFLAEPGFKRDVFRYTVAILVVLAVSWSCFMLIEAFLANRHVGV